ncbi:hypothetical protein CK626_06050 [Vandammella animalimorsus]|nr:hypothetical protein CK626_06050 [Vandammella animalimorsus]
MHPSTSDKLAHPQPWRSAMVATLASNSRRAAPMYRFIARSSAPLQYLDADAKRLLKIIGKDDAATGIITLAQIPAAQQAIERAIAQEEAAGSDMPPADQAAPAPDDEQPQDRVALRHRALPLLQLLAAAASAQEDVIWEH